MAFSVQVDLSKVQALMARLSPAEMATRSRAAMLESTQYLKGEVQQATPVDRGIGRGSVVAQVNGTGVDLNGRVQSVEPHMIVLEKGRRPGARMPPLAPIRSWLRRHGKDERLAFVVARAIGRRGTQAHRMFEGAARKGGPVVTSIFVRHFRV